MDLGGRRRSSNVEDRRGQSPQGGFPTPGGRGAIPGGAFNILLSLFAGRGGGPGKIILVLLVLFFLYSSLVKPAEQRHEAEPQRRPVEERQDNDYVPASEQEDRQRMPDSKNLGRYAEATDEELKDMLLVVLASTEDVWTDIFAEYGRTYEPTTLVLFTDYVQSACGMNTAATGPFYCPADGKTYMDLGFFRELSRRFGADGDGAIAYVLAHEVGHHVQNQLGISDQVNRFRRTATKAEMNRMTVRLELQADYFAGVWAHHAGKIALFEPEDAEEAIIAALAIGDDRLQMQTQGRVSPENFTHGTSEQRKRWFERGYEYGDIEHGDTFALDYDELRRGLTEAEDFLLDAAWPFYFDYFGQEEAVLARP
ncbi:MAG: neutral zinc metallopeptidase [Eubacteriales bacterium]|nr:neutral zinc metallopeptidase [Eubacteriales bacterium]